VLIVDGSTVRQLSGLAIDGYADLQWKRIQSGDREKTMLWMQITEVGRTAIVAAGEARATG
jgi:hypothetical protein